MIVRGVAHKVGPNVNIDGVASDCDEAASSAMTLPQWSECLDREFLQGVAPGDFIVATTNFGCGSTRVQALAVLLEAGLTAVIASSFARILFRNAVNVGLPLLEAPAAAEAIETGDELEVDLDTGSIRVVPTGRRFSATPAPDFPRRVVQHGGLIQYARIHLTNPGRADDHTG